MAVFAADGDRTVIKLHIVRDVLVSSGNIVDFNLAGEKMIAKPGTGPDGQVPGATVHAIPIADQPGSYRISVKGKDGGDPATATISPGQTITIELQRRFGKLPYQIKLSDRVKRDGGSEEYMFWSENYRAEGTLDAGACKALLVIRDMQSDGIFNRSDFLTGSAAGIDLNGDGRIFGKGEWIFGGEVFQFCGKTFFVDPDSLEQDGSAVTVVETSLTPPKLGEKVPTLALQTTSGETLHSEDWKGKVVLLDFWASWCGYCIEGFSILKELRTQLGSNLQIISINTDEPSEIPAANKVLREHALPWPSVLSGKGLNDPVWMLFQALGHSLPLYAILDRQGIVRYSGSGGEKLVELRNALEKLIPGKLN